MKILVLTWEFPPRIIGGISRHVAELYPELVKLGHKVHLITVQASGVDDYEIVDGISVYRVPVANNSDFFGWVVHMNESMVACATKLLDDEGPFDILHAHDWLVSDAAINIHQRHLIPLIATIHATEYGRYNGIHTDTQRYVNNKEIDLAAAAQRVIVCTKYMRSEMERALQCPLDKVDIVNNGLSTERATRSQHMNFDRAAFRGQFAEPEESIVYYVGRLTHEKGIYLLLNAAPKIIAETDGKVKFVIIGSGDAYSILLQHQAWDLGIYHKVLFTGFMSDDDLSKFQAIADCAVFPSLYEPFGIVALESFAAKVPVVVSDTGGLPEVVRHGVTGVVTQVNNSDSLAAGILEVLQNSEYAKKLVANAQVELKVRFAWPHLARQTETIYKNILAQAQQKAIGSQAL
jgi:glycosyltransferase involved in cell wall biosynthesis